MFLLKFCVKAVIPAFNQSSVFQIFTEKTFKMSSSEYWNNFFYNIGIVTSAILALKYSFKFVNNIGTFFFSLGEVDFKFCGKWAVVTGATDGIGKAYAEQLAERGCDIVLLSRTLSKLEVMARDLRQRFNVEVKVIAADFTGKFRFELGCLYFFLLSFASKRSNWYLPKHQV